MPSLTVHLLLISSSDLNTLLHTRLMAEMGTMLRVGKASSVTLVLLVLKELSIVECQLTDCVTIGSCDWPFIHKNQVTVSLIGFSLLKCKLQ